jgi:predicted kinase
LYARGGRAQSATIVILNGAFGVGKSTVARLISTRLRGVAIFDPEKIGYLLMRLPSIVPGSARQLDDYQDSQLWRRLTVVFGCLRARTADLVIMPMTFVRQDYVAEIRSGFARAGIRTHEVCLTAKQETLVARLGARGVDAESREGRWVYPRSVQAAVVHRTGTFGLTIPTDGLDAAQVTDRVFERLKLVTSAVDSSHSDALSPRHV